MAAGGPTIQIGGKEYDVNRDFTWRELITVEELGGVPLARDEAMETFGVMAAFVFVVMRREDESLTWEAFLDGSLSDISSNDPEPEPEAEAGDGDVKAAKRRPPTKPSA